MEIIDGILCANLFFLFFTMHGNIRLFSKCRTSPQVRAAYRLFPQATATDSTSLLPSGVPRLTINQTGRVFLKNCHASRPSQAGTWPPPPPHPPLASSEFSVTAFSSKETQKQKARTIKQRYRLSAFSRHDRHPFASQVFGTRPFSTALATSRSHNPFVNQVFGNRRLCVRV